MRVDVHQHLWTRGFVAALRERDRPPRLDGWTLLLDGEPDFAVDPRDHDVPHRLELNRADRLGLALVSLSAPLGIELLPGDQGAALLDAYHVGVLALPEGFGAWAAASVAEPDAPRLAGWLDAGCVGLQLPASALCDRAGYERCEPLLRVLEARGKPLFVHAGPAAARGAPPWWAANVEYVQQMHAAYHAFAAFGRAAHPGLRVCFAMLCGLAPLHRERAAARGGPDLAGDRAVWFETSSYGPAAVAAVGAALDAARGGSAPSSPDEGGHASGRDGEAAGPRIVLGSDRPYAAPGALADEAAAERAVRDLLALG
ncbi:MAG: amidohydrolase [Actinocrinis sp.]